MDYMLTYTSHVIVLNSLVAIHKSLVSRSKTRQQLQQQQQQLEQKAAGGQILGSAAAVAPIPEHAQLAGQFAPAPVRVLPDPAREPAHIFLIHFTSLNHHWPLHGPILRPREVVVQPFLELSQMRPFGRRHASGSGGS